MVEAFAAAFAAPTKENSFSARPLPPGLLKRIGCGDDAVLHIAAALELKASKQTPGAMVVPDSIDGADPGGFVYRFDLRKCGL